MDLKKITIFICGIWLAIVAIWIMQAEITLKTGREVLLKTVPVDPRDMLMGDYVILNYEISQVPIDNSQNFTCDINKVLYVILKTNSNNIASIKEVSYELPKGELRNEENNRNRPGHPDSIRSLCKRCIRVKVKQQDRRRRNT